MEGMITAKDLMEYHCYSINEPMESNGSNDYSNGFNGLPRVQHEGSNGIPMERIISAKEAM